MNKILLTFFGIMGTLSVFSQSFTQANEPMVGETKTMFLCDSNAVDFAATTGTGVTWDYSNLTSYAGQTKVMEVVSTSATPFANDFPVSTAATRIENFTYTFIYSSATERASDGYVLENTDIGDVKAKFTSNAQLLMNYPSSVGATLVDSFAGNLSFTYSGIPQNPVCTGISYAKYDGIGTLNQPNGSVLTNISRYHFADTLWTTIPIIGAAQIIRSQYEYYDLTATNHLPVFMHMSAKLVSGFPDPLIDATVVLSEVSGPATAQLSETTLNNIKVFPNPAKDYITIQNIPSDAIVTLTDLTGRAVVLNTNGNDQFRLTNISKGIYVMKISSNQGIQTQSLVVE